MSTADNEVQELINSAQTPADIDYGSARSALYKAIYAQVKVKDSTTSEWAPSLSDINFLSHEVRNGWMYNEIYVHITPQAGQKTIILQETGFASEPTRTGMAFSVETGEYEQSESSRDNLKFNAIILYYSLYAVDPTNNTADTQPIVIDMPLGVYIPDEVTSGGACVNVKISTEALYGQGTTWATRICSRLANSATMQAVDSEHGAEYATLTKVLSEFGEIADVMKDILHRRETLNSVSETVQSTSSLALAPEDIKAYLEEFRRENAVNVPYIKDNHWFVNGRDLGTVAENADWVGAFGEWFDSASDEDLSRLKGEKGEKGDTGAQGPQGEKGDTGAQGQAGLQGSKGEKGDKGDKGEDGETPEVKMVGTHIYINGLDYGDLKGEKGDTGSDGKDGRDGKDGKDGADGATGPAGPQGPQGPVGPAGSDGAAAEAPTVEMVGTHIYINGVDCGDLKGDAGEDGSDGSDASITFYGWTNSALNANGTAFSPTSQSTNTDGIKPGSTVNLSVEHLTASTSNQFIWKYDGTNWVLDNWLYVSDVEAVQEGLKKINVNASLSYGSLLIDTDIIIGIFKLNNGGSGFVAQDDAKTLTAYKLITETTQAVTDISESSTSTDLYITMERWDPNSKTIMLTTTSAIQQIFEAICDNDDNTGFKWKTLRSYFSQGLPSMPFVIRFANGLFTIQDVHNFAVDSSTGKLKDISLNGQLVIHNGGQSYLQGSHGNTLKYGLVASMAFNMKSSSSTYNWQWETGSSYNIVTQFPNANTYT
jgi:hypothetical protein